MKHPNINRTFLLLIIGIIIGLIVEIILTCLYSWEIKGIIDPNCYFAASIISMACIGVTLLYLYLKVIQKYPYKYNYRYLTSFLLYDAAIVVGGIIGKALFQLD